MKRLQRWTDTRGPMDGIRWKLQIRKRESYPYPARKRKGLGFRLRRSLVVLGSRFVKISLNCAPALQESP
jgi:hypothetical protein